MGRSDRVTEDLGDEGAAVFSAPRHLGAKGRVSLFSIDYLAGLADRPNNLHAHLPTAAYLSRTGLCSKRTESLAIGSHFIVHGIRRSPSPRKVISARNQILS